MFWKSSLLDIQNKLAKIYQTQPLKRPKKEMFRCLEEYGYKCICHMVNEDRAALRQTITSMPRENEKEIQMHGGAGETGIKVT